MKRILKSSQKKSVRVRAKGGGDMYTVLTAITILESRMKAGFKDVRSEMQVEFKNVRSEIQDELKNARSEMHAGFEMLAGQISDVHTRVDALEAKVDSNHTAVMTGIDGMVKKYTDLDSEYVSMKAHANRAAAWGKVVGTQVGVPYPHSI